MRLLLLAFVGVCVIGWDICALFFAWFTIGFFGVGFSQLLFAGVCIAAAVAVTWHGIRVVRGRALP